MIKKISLSILLCVLLLNAESNQKPESDQKAEAFKDKYLKNKETGAKDFKFESKMDSNFDAKKFADINATKQLEGFDYNKKDEQQAKNIADQINSEIRSAEYEKKVKDYEEYILEDKGMNLQQHGGQYNNYYDKAGSQGATYKNQYLGQNERLIIAISSSVPKSTIRNYFESLENVNQDVMFILNGFVGNDPKYIMPTIKYIEDLLVIDQEKEKGYAFRVDINPKLFSKYNIEQAPAVIFIKNYDPYDEISGNAFIENKKNNEEVYVSYGDAGIEHVLKKINQKAKSEGLKKMIKNLRKGFFDEN